MEAEAVSLLCCESLGLRPEASTAVVTYIQSWGQGQAFTERSAQRIFRAAGARSDWQECPPGIAASERQSPPRTRVVEVPGKLVGVRVFVVHSEEREQYERSLRQLAMERARQSLEAIRVRVEQGDLKEPEKIGAAVARALRVHHGHRYFAWELRSGQLHYFEHPVNLNREQALEGKYVIQTEEPHLSAREAVAAYKELSDVERGFAHLKGWLEVRPIYHHWPRRVEAHVFVAALAFLLDRALEKKLRAAGSQLSSPFAWRTLETVRYVGVRLNQQRKLCVSRRNAHAAQVLKALGLTRLDPPQAPTGEETVM